MIKESEIVSLLRNPKLNSKKDHYVSDCPFCKKEKHFYLNRNKITKKIKGKFRNAFDCKKCSVTGNIVTLLKLFNKLHLLDGEEILFGKKVRKLFDVKKGEEEIEQTLFVKKRKLPTGFKRKFNDEYLKSRGFRDNEFGKYIVGRSNLLSKMKNYIIIAIEENSEIKGYISRSTLTKSQIFEFESINEGKKILRYRNSKSDFSKLVFGIDEIMFNTNWVIIVEGLFDKTNVDIKLNLDSDSYMKCVSTFGKSISDIQMLKIRNRGVENVILIQDEDAIKDTKRHSYTLQKYFKNVLVGFKGGEDIGDASEDEVIEVMNNLRTPNSYNLNILRKITK